VIIGIELIGVRSIEVSPDVSGYGKSQSVRFGRECQELEVFKWIATDVNRPKEQGFGHGSARAQFDELRDFIRMVALIRLFWADCLK
jgi:hypothetical protein